MSKNIVEELPARKHAPAAAPAAKKGGDKPEAKKGGKATGSVEEGSEKKIRQAVYDIRYRARREDIDLKAAYSQYMSNSSLSQAERTAVREKLFGKEGGGVKEQFAIGAEELAGDNISKTLYKVFVEKQEKEIDLEYLKQLEEDAESKYQVRVTDKNGKVYSRNATRSKITQLRQNPNIKSVEMSDHGEPYEGKKAKKDYDGDGKVESGSKEHAGAVHNAIQRAKGGKPDGKDTRKEALERAWKQAFLADGTITTEPKNKTTKVTGEGVDNYKSGAVKVAPTDTSGEDPSIKAARGGIYASFAHQKMLDVIAEKAACASKKKKKAYSEALVNTPECEKKPEEEKDMRGTYAKINLVKNKLRSMGQKDPCVMLADIDSEDEKKKVDEGLGSAIQDKLKNTFTKVDELKKRYPGIAGALESIVKPINPKATGRDTVTQSQNQANIDKNKK
tara:strand:- start:78 stop:1421 length:1344 start_codon:yes stop_codon:yes gene_type:complete